MQFALVRGYDRAPKEGTLSKGPLVKKEEMQQIAAMVAEMMRVADAPAKPKGEVMETLTARVPHEFIDLLDRIGAETRQSRSEVLRDILRATAEKRARK